MDVNKEHDVEDDRPPSPVRQVSEETGRVASEAVHGVYNGSCSSGSGGSGGSESPVGKLGERTEMETPGSSTGSGTPSSSTGSSGTGTGHRRVQSEVVTSDAKPRHSRTNSFQKLKIHVQRAFQMGGFKEPPKRRASFNPEILVNQKRQWYQLRNKKDVSVVYKEPTFLFENFVVVGLPADANLKSAEEVFAKKKTWELQMAKTEVFDMRTLRYRGACDTELEPQILFKYPPGKKLAVHWKELPAFCFPQDVKARLMERTPSMSDLNAVVHGQEHLGRDDLSFIFSLKGADNTTLYGVCLHVHEIVQRSPGIIGVGSPFSQLSGGRSRFLVSAPRCYCLLTRVPFFELHYEMLNSIVTQERLNRITQFISEMNITDYSPSPVGEQDGTNGISDTRIKKNSSDWTAFAIPVDCAGALTAAAMGIIAEDEVQSFSSKVREPETPESISASEVSDISQTKEIDKESGKGVHQFDCYSSETLESPCSDFERMYGSFVNGHASPVVDISFCERRASSESLISSVRSMGSEDEDYEVSSLFDKNAGDDTIIQWAKDHKNELLQIVCSYHALPLPPYGGEIVFQPLEHLQAIKYSRPTISSFGLHGIPSDINIQSTLRSTEVNVRLAAAEEALSLSIWTTATICRALSLDSILAVFAGVLLEKQVVVVCPNLGVLSAVVLSLIPMIRPFEWQSLFLPILPRKLLEFLEAPVPFIVGIQQKPADVKLKTANLIYVDVNKDKVTICYMPPLPRRKELISELLPIHATLSSEKSLAKRHPVYKCSEVQAEAAGQFSNIMVRYLESLCSDLRSHTITSVQSNNDKVSLLFKDSFIDSFPNKDRPFVKLLLDTQLFSVLSDSRISSFELQ